MSTADFTDQVHLWHYIFVYSCICAVFFLILSCICFFRWKIPKVWRKHRRYKRKTMIEFIWITTVATICMSAISGVKIFAETDYSIPPWTESCESDGESESETDFFVDQEEQWQEYESYEVETMEESQTFLESATYVESEIYIESETIVVETTEVETNPTIVVPEDVFPPSIGLIGIDDQGAYQIGPEITITVEDQYYNPNGTTISLFGQTKGSIDLSGIINKTLLLENKQVYLGDFSQLEDDLYTFTVASVDIYGNKTVESKNFSINKKGSSIIIENTLSSSVFKTLINQEDDIILQEINIDNIVYKTLSYSKDGQIVHLKEYQDYLVEEQVLENGRKAYTYRIFAKSFKDDGTYALQFFSEDKAGNKTSFQSGGQNIEFVVDQTAPIVVISNLESHGIYKGKEHLFTVEVKDNMSVEQLVCYINGRKVLNYNHHMIIAEDGRVTLAIPTTKGYGNVVIKAVDQAGNTTWRQMEQVYVNGGPLYGISLEVIFGGVSILVLLLIVESKSIVKICQL